MRTLTLSSIVVAGALALAACSGSSSGTPVLWRTSAPSDAGTRVLTMAMRSRSTWRGVGLVARDRPWRSAPEGDQYADAMS